MNSFYYKDDVAVLLDLKKAKEILIQGINAEIKTGIETNLPTKEKTSRAQSWI